jgi:hypothetical protein
VPPQHPTDTLSLLAGKLEGLGYDWMLVGSVAAFFHGYQRSTMDIDIVLDTRGVEPERLARTFAPDYMLDPRMAEESLERGTMFNAISLVGGPKVDFAPLTDDDFEQSAFRRKLPVEWHGGSLWVIDAMDLVLSKLRWALASESQRQLADVRAIMALELFDEHDAYFQRWVRRLRLGETLDASRAAGYDA